MKSKLPEEWKEVKLGAIVDFNNNNYNSNCNWEYVNYLDTGNITSNIIADIQFLDLKIDKLPSRAKRKINANDVLYSTVRPIQKHMGIIKSPLKNMLVSTGFAVMTANPNEVDPTFVYFYLSQNGITNYLQAIAEQRVSTYPALNIIDLKELEIYLPPLPEQKAIAATLSALDDKIENNNRINENLETQAQAIFKHWFVDFEFPDENGNPYKSSGGAMVESELGLIPEGWGVVRLGEISNIRYGKNLPIKKLIENGYDVFGGNGVIGFFDEYMYEDPEVLISCRGAASGKTNISNPKSFVTNNSLVLESPNRIIFEYLKNRFKFEDLKEYATGSAQPQITINNIKNVQILKPGINQLKHFYNISSSISKIEISIRNENQTLAQIRDTLLPKLMSGEIRIPLD